MSALEVWLGLLVAVLGGAAVGLERQRSGHADGPLSHFAGLRTFTLLGGLAGLAGWLWQRGLGAAALVLLGAGAALVLVGYAAAAGRDLDATTEVAALVVLAAGLLAGLGEAALASAVFALTSLILLEKRGLHNLAARLGDEELRAALRFGVMALVILPLLPPGPLGPLAIRPRQLWLLVLFFSGISFAGTLARRWLGLSRGYAAAGLVGGLISSTNVTLSFARLSRAEPAASLPLALGAVAANAVLFPRVLLTAYLLRPELATALWPILAPPFALVALTALAGLRASRSHGAALAPPGNPLQLRAALQMALVFQLVIWLTALVDRWGGPSGLLATGAFLGVTDVDALTISMAQTEGPALGLATEAVGVGILANTVFKLGLALTLGSARYRWLLGAVLVGVGVLLGVGVWG